MKNFLFAFFAFANLIASGMAGPVGKEDAGLEARESHDYSNHKQAVHNLLQDVLLQTGQMSKAPMSSYTFPKEDLMSKMNRPDGSQRFQQSPGRGQKSTRKTG